MDRMQNGRIDIDDRPVISFWSLMLLLGGAAWGAVAALLVLPSWMPAMESTLQGNAPQVFWFLSRSSAGIAYTLLWLSMIAGLLITNKLARLWPGGPAAVDLHQFLSLFGLAFALFHAFILMGDQYIHYSLVEVLIPFASQQYRAFWVGLGQVSIYLLGIVALSFYVRRRITYSRWRFIHYFSFLTYALALVHGLQSGSDSSLIWVNRFYWLSAGVLIFLFFYRLLTPAIKQPMKAGSQLD